MRVKKIDKNIFNLIGLATKAGKTVSGSYAVLEAIKSKKAKLVIISVEASDNTIDKFQKRCEAGTIDYIMLGKKTELGRSIGRFDRTLVAVTDENFKNMILDAMKKFEDHGGDMDV